MKKNATALGSKPWLAVWGVMLLVCLGFGLATHASYTTYSLHPEKLADLPYLYYAATPDDLAPHSEHPENGGVIDVDKLIETTPIIVRGVFEGNRTYGYQTFVSGLRVTEVYRGSEVSVGQTIPLFEPARIRQLSWADSWKRGAGDSYKSFFEHFGIEDGSAPPVVQPSSGAYLYGGTLMRPGQEYAFFLYPKTYPDVEDRAGKPQEYILMNSPYARLAMGSDGSAAETATLDPSADFISLSESQDYDILLSEEADPETYEQTRETILERIRLLTG